jgi:integrase
VYRGLRRGEILALRWTDIDLDEGFLEISRNVVQLGYATEEGTPKSEESERVIALDDDTIAVLTAHKARQYAERRLLGPAYQDDGLVFAKADGSPLHPEYVSRHLRVLIKRAGVPPITFHQLRHTAASLMLEAGYELKYVQHMLGHSSVTVTAKLYLHITRRLDQKRSGQVARLVPRNRLLPPDDAGAVTLVA